jgi:hypothetical protein
MTKQTQKGLPRRTGKRSAKYPRYFANTEAKKLRHATKRNGPTAAKKLKEMYFDKKYKK